MNILIKVAGVVSVALALNQNTQAVPIIGSIGFTGGVTFNTSSSATATQVTSWITPTVTVTPAGAFSSIVAGSAATFANPPWNLNTGIPVSPIIFNFWSVDGFSFELVASWITPPRIDGEYWGYLAVKGIGIVTSSNPAYDPTIMYWNFTSQNPPIGSNPATWTFSASGIAYGAVAVVPDGGQTVMLFGFALSSLALARRHFAF